MERTAPYGRRTAQLKKVERDHDIKSAQTIAPKRRKNAPASVWNWLAPANRLFLMYIHGMQYRGVEFNVVRAIQRGKWKWTVSMDPLVRKPDLLRARSSPPPKRVALSGTPCQETAIQSYGHYRRTAAGYDFAVFRSAAS